MKEIITPLGKVTLALDTVIDISRNTPLFNRSEEFSIDLIVPRIPNEKIFGYKWRPATRGEITPIEARLLLNGREKLRGSIEIISASYESYNLLLKGSRNDFLFWFGKEKLRGLPFEYEDFVPGYSPPFQPSEAQMLTQMLATLSGTLDYMCFPVYNSLADSWINRWSFDANGFTTNDNVIYPGHGGDRTPFLRMGAALDRVFQLKGYTVTENWFNTDPVRRKICIFNDTNYGVSSSINIRYLYPDWTILDFINEVEDFFPVTIFIDPRTKTVRVLGDDDVVTSVPAGELAPYLERDYTISFNEKQTGYNLKYTLPAEDKSTDSDYEYMDEAYNAEIYTKRDLATTSQEGAVDLVLSEGNFYKATSSEPNNPGWELIGNVALGVRNDLGEISRETKIYPMMNITQVQLEEVTLTQQYVNPIRKSLNFEMVVPTTAKARHLWTQDLRPMIYRGLDAAYINPNEINPGFSFNNKYYPKANFLNRKNDGTQWAGQSLELRWVGDGGLRGPETIAFLEGADKITGKFLIHQADLEKLDTSKVYTLDGRRVLLSELVIHYAEGDLVEVDVVLLAQKIG